MIKLKIRSKNPEIIAKRIVNISDIVIEVVDSRVPLKTRVPWLEKYIKKLGKKFILVINKEDLIPKEFKKEVENILNEEKVDYCFLSVRERSHIRKLRYLIRKNKRELDKDRIIIGVVGLVNTGKSSVINLLKGKHSARTSPMPGFTRGYQLLRLEGNIYLIDTPGVVERKEKDLISELYRPQIKNPEEVAEKLLEKIREVNPEELKRKYNLQDLDGYLLEKVAISLKRFLKSGKFDLHNTAQKIISDWHKGELVAWWL